MNESYAEVKSAVESAGFFTTFMPIEVHGDRMVCASHKRTHEDGTTSLGGTSFWVAKRGDDWFVATWSGLPYRVPDRSRLVSLSLELLSRDDRGALSDSDFGPDVRQRFALVSISPDEFDALNP